MTSVTHVLYPGCASWLSGFSPPHVARDDETDAMPKAKNKLANMTEEQRRQHLEQKMLAEEEERRKKEELLNQFLKASQKKANSVVQATAIALG